MRKKFTKALALACAFAMLAPATVPAYAEEQATSSNYEGGSIIESDNSEIPELTRVVLPTIDENTYDFTIDVEGLLKEFDPVNYDSSNVYFKADNAAATLTVPTATNHTYSFKLKTMDATVVTDSGSDGIGDDILTAIGGTGKTVEDLAAKKYYVWQPDAAKQGSTGEGKFTLITADNYSTFLKVTFDTTVGQETQITAIAVDTPKAGTVDTIWDGKIYVEKYTAATATDYYDAVNNKFDENLFVEDVDASASPSVTKYLVPVVGTAAEGQIAVTYTAPTTHFTNTTNAAAITNKSTFDIGVLADVTMVAEGLNFVAGSSALTTADTAADIYVGIADAAYDGSTNTNIAYVATASGANTAQAAFVIPGTGTTAITYQTEEVDANTGGHKYYQYLAPVSAYASAKFVVTAGADTDYTTSTNSAAAWDAYIETIKADGSKKPTISIVYKFVKTPTNADSTNNSGSEWDYKAANNALFTITGTAALTVADGAAWAKYDTTQVVKVTVAVAGSNGTANKTSAELGDTILVTPNVTTSGKMAGTASVTYFKTGDSGSASGTIANIALNSAGKYEITVPSDAIAGAFTITIAEVDKTGFELTSYEYTAGTALTVKMFPTNGTIGDVAYINAGGASTALTADTDYTISGNAIAFSASAGKFYTISNNRKTNSSGDLIVTLSVVVNGTTYTVPFTIHPAP